MNVITKYECPVCKSQYLDKKQAESCMNREFKPTVQVGDIVKSKFGFGWNDGDKKWIINPEIDPRAKHGFGPKESWGFYYVVTHIDRDHRDPHRVRYHIATQAMSGNKGHLGGYTYDEGHYGVEKIDNPPKHVVDTSKKMIGMKFDYLL